MSDVATVINNYIAIWNEADPDRRRDLIDVTWSEDATYLDPLMSGDGPDGIDAMIAAAQRHNPGHRFVLVAGPDAHNDRVRFTWQLLTADGAAVAVGIDFGVLDADGRLRAVTGFLEAAA